MKFTDRSHHATRGRGHWLGMSLFNTGHDHGGGSFAVIDAGVTTASFPVNYIAGKTEITVQLMNQYNVNFNWAGFAWRELT